MKSCLIIFILCCSSAVFAQVNRAKVDTGIASYYADKFHGKKTASGAIFCQDSLTAAHKTLPFGTRVKVTNLRNKEAVIVIVNDRGMAGKKRIIDLSKAAAKQISMLDRGLAKVSVEVLD